MEPEYILGISAYYHDSAAALVKQGQVVAAVQEERFSRIKHDSAFPAQAVAYCLESAGITPEQISAVVFYDKPLLKFDRILESHLAFAPFGIRSFVTSMPVWLKEKLFLKQTLKKALADLWKVKVKALPQLLFTEHHQSHAASAFFPAPYEQAAVLCLDGVGEWASTTLWKGQGNTLTPVWQIDFPHSLGLLYSAFTYYAGFKVNSGEYKLMGLAPYGEPRYVKQIYEHLIDVKDDGSFALNMEYFDYVTGLRMVNAKFCALFGGPARTPESPLSQKEMDLARSIQVVTEEIVLKLAFSAHAATGLDNLCLAGGVALNCVANGRLKREGPFKNIWVQPAASDAGGALGAALSGYYEYFGQPRTIFKDTMRGGYLGPEYNSEQIRQSLKAQGAVYHYYEEAELLQKTAAVLASDHVVGWFQGRMEYGPRALGNRSILGNPRSTTMQSVMNLKIKFRESFRPFAPAVLESKASEWFAFEGESPYMLFVGPIHADHRLDCQEVTFGLDRLKEVRSKLPAITHVDYSARLQTVTAERNERFYGLLTELEAQTGCPVVINTSFNVRGEPIVMTPEDAYRCFMRTQMDYLVVGNYFMAKSEQPAFAETQDWQQVFALD